MATAMVIDDSKAMRMILARSLVRFGYEVRGAANGKEALEYLEQHAPELAQDGRKFFLRDVFKEIAGECKIDRCGRQKR